MCRGSSSIVSDAWCLAGRESSRTEAQHSVANRLGRRRSTPWRIVSNDSGRSVANRLRNDAWCSSVLRDDSPRPNSPTPRRFTEGPNRQLRDDSLSRPVEIRQLERAETRRQQRSAVAGGFSTLPHPLTTMKRMGPDTNQAMSDPLGQHVSQSIGDRSQPYVTGPWWCPVCDTPTPHRYRAGRQKVYCSNACRQKAYRWRRAHGVRFFATAAIPAERADGRALRHALRDTRDPVAFLRAPRGREVTVCGTFSRPARNQLVRHTRFLPGSINSCQSCVRNVGVVLETFVDAPEFTFNTPEFWAHVGQPSNIASLEPPRRSPPPPLPTERPLWRTGTSRAV